MVEANGVAVGVAVVESNTACGLVMPISAIDGCTPEHWTEVRAIITESMDAIEEYNFTVKLVSEADDVGVIQKRIVQSIYNSDIVICDVSCKNPNVMFELGMRLAFDKPTVIIKDDKTDYSFDTAIIEHIPHPRDLRFSKMVNFKTQLAQKVVGTLKASKNPDQSTFLKNFGTFHVASLSQQAVPTDKYIVEMLTDMQKDISRLRMESGRGNRRQGKEIEGSVKIAAELAKFASENPGLNISTLKDDAGFQSDMIQKCTAPIYFPHRPDFIRTLKQAIDEIYNDRSPDPQQM